MPVSASCTSASSRRPGAEILDLDELPFASPEVAEALERNRPGPMTLEEYGRFCAQFTLTPEELRARPTFEGATRFTLDD